MAVRLREWVDAQGKARQTWIVDVRFSSADGTARRLRQVSPVNTKRGALEFERQIQAAFLSGWRP